MDASARLGLPYLVAGQMQKHITVNEALTRLDVLVQTRIASRSTAAQPATPVDGDLYILPTAPTGAVWGDLTEGDLVRADTGGWTVEPAAEGMVALVADEGVVIVRRSGVWIGLGEALGEIHGLARFGLNTTADAANPFAARVGKALWAAPGGADGGDLRFTFNKETTSDVLSLLFQSGWSGRAELGLIGDDDLILKVSDDGGTWREAMRVAAATGAATFAAGTGRVESTTLTADATWSPPVWARRVEILAVGGGGGGGAGMAGPNGAERFGGGGGGAGGVSCVVWNIDQLGGDLEVTVGSGGVGAVGASSGAGGAGSDGGSSLVHIGGVTLLTGAGGQGGRGGSASSGAGGAGGLGVAPGNRGGESLSASPGVAGAALECPQGGGGGGGGGGLNSAGTVRAGGAGGAGAVAGASATGGAGGTASAGGAGAHPVNDLWAWAGGGGGGGGSSISTGYAGGAGQIGAGGGGGGAGVSMSGAGGAGGAGLVILTAIG